MDNLTSSWEVHYTTLKGLCKTTLTGALSPCCDPRIGGVNTALKTVRIWSFGFLPELHAHNILCTLQFLDLLVRKYSILLGIWNLIPTLHSGIFLFQSEECGQNLPLSLCSLCGHSFQLACLMSFNGPLGEG